ncbi:hypothetical protein [Humibacter ginsenosidimutans]|uniref:Uncharacterized protein n=1 Tax=Humibacter ginsenosidimutans TaxID=2599293 RepID=A0A5B8LYM7_9MICO|nr:hypothetical protein [Humibacter ginsenosidimutans]QDZ13437.1 hypothetical protein FPZ11_00175 [Humibacter ginsenosidimutans]
MTENTASGSAFVGRSGNAHRALQGIEHGYVAPVDSRSPRGRFSLWTWFSTALEHSGRVADRDTERAHRDLQAARDRSEW